MANNIKIDMRLDARYAREAVAFAMAMRNRTVDGTIKPPSHYVVVPKLGLVLFWHKPDKTWPDPAFPNDNTKNIEAIPFPPIEVEVFVESWLNKVNTRDFPATEHWEKDLEDFDGSTGKGFRLYTEDWGHAGGTAYGLFVVRPVYMWYGK